MTRRNWAWIAGGLVLAATLVWQLFFWHHEHAVYWYHRVPGFDAVFGLAGTLGIIWFSKTLGEFFLQRGEDYYED